MASDTKIPPEALGRAYAELLRRNPGLTPQNPVRPSGPQELSQGEADNGPLNAMEALAAANDPVAKSLTEGRRFVEARARLRSLAKAAMPWLGK